MDSEKSYTANFTKKQYPLYLGTDEFGTEFYEPVMEDTIILPENARAQQGIMTHPNRYYYVTENKNS